MVPKALKSIRQPQSCLEIRRITSHADSDRGVDAEPVGEPVRDSEAQRTELQGSDASQRKSDRGRGLCGLVDYAVLIADAERCVLVERQPHAHGQVEYPTGIHAAVTVADLAGKAVRVRDAAEEDGRIRWEEHRDTRLNRIEAGSRGEARLQSGVRIDRLLEHVRSGMRLVAQ